MSSAQEQPLRVIFMASPDATVPILDALCQDKRIEVVLLMVPPDKPKGRGQTVQFSALKQYALEHKVPLFQPELINTEESMEEIEGKSPDFIFLIGYGKIIGQELLSLPRYGCINLHGALLPKYRGPAPIQAAILHGEKETGITYIQMDEGLDTGDLIYQEKTEIKKGETADKLQKRLAAMVQGSIVKVLVGFASGELKPVPQDKAAATYCHILHKEDGKIDWSENVTDIVNKVHALHPWPGAFTQLGRYRLKIMAAEGCNKPVEHKPGTFFLSDKGESAIACGDGYLLLKKVQLEGKKEISGSEFARGYAKMALTRCH